MRVSRVWCQPGSSRTSHTLPLPCRNRQLHRLTLSLSQPPHALELKLSSQAIIAEQLSAAPAQKCYDPGLSRHNRAIRPRGAGYRPRRFPTRPRVTRGPTRRICSAGHMSRMDPDGARGAAAFHHTPLAPHARQSGQNQGQNGAVCGRMLPGAILPACAEFCCGKRDAQRLDNGYAKCDDEGRLALAHYSNNGYQK